MDILQWNDVGSIESFSVDEPVQVVVESQPIAVFRKDDGWYALHDLCSHGHARLSEGFVDGDCVECPLHQGLIDIRTGQPCSAPITDPVRTYPIRTEAGRVQIAAQAVQIAE